MPKISRRAGKILASPIRKFLPLMEKAEKRGIKVFKLNVGDPDIIPPPLLLKTIRKYRQKSLGYAPSPGIKEHTDAWSKYYSTFGIKLPAANIIPTVGGAEAILLALLAVADAGQEVIVFEPLYTSYKGFATMAGIKLKPITLKVENNFALPPAKEITKKITKKTKAVVVINPDNPTGKVWTKQELATIVQIARQHNLFVIADETYREIVFKEKPSSFLQLAAVKNQVIIVDSVSKRFSCPGARIGCLTSFNQDVIGAVLKFAMVRLSAPTLEQIGLIPLLKNSAVYTKKIAAEYKKRRNLVVSALNKMPGVTCNLPQGAFYVIAKLPLKNSEDFVRFLLTKFHYRRQTVMLAPAKDFYVTSGLGSNEIRIAYVLNAQALRKAMKVLAEGLKSYKHHYS